MSETEFLGSDDFINKAVQVWKSGDFAIKLERYYRFYAIKLRNAVSRGSSSYSCTSITISCDVACKVVCNLVAIVFAGFFQPVYSQGVEVTGAI